MKYLLFHAILSLCSTLPLRAQDWGAHIEVRGKADFLAQRKGTLAYLPDARSETSAAVTYRNRLLKSGKTYALRGDRTLYFRINHRSDEPPQATYLGIQIIRFYAENSTATEPVYVYRNDNWFSGGSHLPHMEKTSGMSLDLFSEHHDLREAPDELHGILKANWHASIYPSGEVNSWDKKEHWNLKPLVAKARLGNVFGSKFPEKFEVSADLLLLRFTQSPAPRNSGIHFKLTPGNARAVILRTFAPNTRDYDNLIYLTFTN